MKNKIKKAIKKSGINFEITNDSEILAISCYDKKNCWVISMNDKIWVEFENADYEIYKIKFCKIENLIETIKKAIK